MKRPTLKVSASKIAKRYDNAATPKGFLPMEWEAARDAHARGLLGYTVPGRPQAVWSLNADLQWVAVGILGESVKVPVYGVSIAPVLELAAGCLRCGEPLDKNASDETCTPCARELAAKARLESIEARDRRRVDVPYLQIVPAEVSP